MESKFFQTQDATEKRTQSSKANLKAKFSGCEPEIFYFNNFVLVETNPKIGPTARMSKTKLEL